MTYGTEEIRQALEQVQLVSPPKTLIDHEWVIALISATLGFIFAIISQFIVEYWKKRELKNSIIVNIFDEVYENHHATTKEKVDSLKTTLEEFQRLVMNTSPSPTSGPSLAYFDINSTHYYDIYRKDFSLLKPRFRERLTHFYRLVESIASRSKKLDETFKGYYKSTGVAGSEDIEKSMQKLIMTTIAADRTGLQVLAIIMKDYNYSGRLPKLTLKDKNLIKLKINEYFKTKKKGDKVTIKEISDQTKIPDLLVAQFTLDDIRLKESLYGEFEIAL